MEGDTVGATNLEAIEVIDLKSASPDESRERLISMASWSLFWKARSIASQRKGTVGVGKYITKARWHVDNFHETQPITKHRNSAGIALAVLLTSAGCTPNEHKQHAEIVLNDSMSVVTRFICEHNRLPNSAEYTHAVRLMPDEPCSIDLDWVFHCSKEGTNRIRLYVAGEKFGSIGFAYDFPGCLKATQRNSSVPGSKS